MLTYKDIVEFNYPKIISQYIHFYHPERYIEDSQNLEEFFKGYVDEKNKFLTKIIFRDHLTYSKKINIKISLEDYLRTKDTPATKKMIDVINEVKNFIMNLRTTSFLPTDFVYFLYYFFSYWKEGTLKEIEDKKKQFCVNGKKYTFYFPQKPVKILKKIYKILEDNGATNPETDKKFSSFIDEISVAYSILNSECNLTGTLEISIDPKEMITASVNNAGWTSCYSPTGCNSGAPLALFNSETAFIAYLRTDKPYRMYPDEACSDQTSGKNYCANKVLRAWVFADSDNLVIGKNYPYHSAAFVKEIINFINELTGNYYEDSSHINKSFQVKVKEIYDDVVCYSVKSKINNNNSNNFIKANDNPICLCCGNQYQKISTELNDLTIICPDCYGYRYCAACKDYYEENEGDYINGVFYCNDCYLEKIHHH